MSDPKPEDLKAADAVPYLLPPSATELERSLSIAFDRATALPVTLRDEWSPERCPAHMLPWLAWAFGVETWDTHWTDAQKRGAIKASLPVKRMQGTIGAVVASIRGLGLDAEVIEWFNQVPPGAPYTFDLVVTAQQDGFDQEQWHTLLAVVNDSKNVRSSLDELRLNVQSVATSYHGTAALMGLNIVVEFEQVDTRGPGLLYVTANQEGTFGRIYDESDYGLELTYRNFGFGFGDGPFENEMYMARGSDAAMITTLARSIGTGDFTLELWIRPQAGDPDSAPGAVYLQLGTNADGHDPDGRVTIARDGMSDPHRLTVTVQHEGQSVTVFAPDDSTTLPEYVWTHVALVNKAGVWSLFVGGRRVGMISPGLVDVRTEVFIGDDAFGMANFIGSFDDVRITAEALYDHDFDPLTVGRS